MFADFCAGFGSFVTNDGNHHGPDKDTWTFRSSVGSKRRIDFVLFSAFLCSAICHVSNDLGLGCDLRVVFANFKLQNTKRGKHQRKHKTKCCWRPGVDANQIPTTYNQMLKNVKKSLPYHTDTSLQGLEFVCKDVVSRSSLHDQPVKPMTAFQDGDFQILLGAKKSETSTTRRAQLSKTIRKEIRIKFRKQRTSTIQCILDDFLYDIMRTNSEPKPLPDEFASFLEYIFASKIGFDSPKLLQLLKETIVFRRICEANDNS